jgi:hypothetical protein
MSPTAKFNALLASTTVFIMFMAVGYVSPFLTHAGVDHPVILSFAALISSAGVYRLLAIALRWLMERFEPLRALVLGPYYMHGTWVGWFRGHAGDLRYMVEHFAQDLDSLVITGRSYTASGKEHGYWLSEAVTIDAKRGQLIFTYSFDVITQSLPLIGIHTSLFERKATYEAPTGYSGFAHDLNDKARIAVHAKKLSNTFEPWDSALANAIERFKNV